MKRLATFIICVFATASISFAQNWCENLIKELSGHRNVDRNVAVNRDPQSFEITNATYDFKFSSSSLYRHIAATMKKHESQADYYSESGNKNKVILMRFSDKGRRWSCKLQPLGGKGNQYLVTVNNGETSFERAARMFDENNRVFEENSKLFEEKRKVFEERQKILNERLQSLEKLKDLDKRLKTSGDKMKSYQKYRLTGKSGASRSYGHTSSEVNPATPEKERQIKEHNNALKLAEQERSRKLAR